MRDRSVLQVLQPEDGGVAEHVLGLALGLRDRGWDVELATSGASAISSALQEASIPVHVLPLVRNPSRVDVAAARALRALDRERGYRLVHAHSSKAGALVRGALAGARRLVYTPHCLAFSAAVGRSQRFLYRSIEQALVPRSGAIVAVCEWERDEAVDNLVGVESRLRVIHNGVEQCAWSEPNPELLGFKEDRPLAGLISVLRPQKDPLLAVQAAAILAQRGSLPGRLAIVGNGLLQQEVKTEIRSLGVADHVGYFPFAGGVGPYLAALDLFVLPSAWEAFPLSVLEAMSCALPVLATRVGGVPEAVTEGETGRLVPPGDADALAGALAELLGDGVRRRSLGLAGQAAFEKRFSVEGMVNAIEALYCELIASNER